MAQPPPERNPLPRFYSDQMVGEAMIQERSEELDSEPEEAK